MPKASGNSAPNQDSPKQTKRAQKKEARKSEILGSLPIIEGLDLPALYDKAQKTLRKDKASEEESLFYLLQTIFSWPADLKQIEIADQFMATYFAAGGNPNLTSKKRGSLLMAALEFAPMQIATRLLDVATNVNHELVEESVEEQAQEAKQDDSTSTQDTTITISTAIDSLNARGATERYHYIMSIYTKVCAQLDLDAARDQANVKQNPLLHPDKELEVLWQKLLAKGVLWHTLSVQARVLKRSIKMTSRLQVCVINDLRQSGDLIPAVLAGAPETSILNIALDAGLGKDNRYTRFLKDNLPSIELIHREAFLSDFGGIEGLCERLVRFSKESPMFMPEFVSICTRCQIAIPSEIWETILANLSDSRVFGAIENLKEAVRSVLGVMQQPINYRLVLEKMLVKPSMSFKYFWIIYSIVTEAAQEQELSAAFNTIDEARGWNFSCYLIDAFRNQRDWLATQSRHGNHESDFLRYADKTWQHFQAHYLTDAAWKATRDTMHVPDNIRGKDKKVFTTANLKDAEGLWAGLVKPGDSRVRVEAQSTHKTMIHGTTSMSEQYLAHRYQSFFLGGKKEQELFGEIEKFYRSTWLTPEREAAFLATLEMSLNQGPILGDTDGSIQRATSSQWMAIQKKREISQGIQSLQNLLIQVSVTIPSEQYQQLCSFLEQSKQENDWKLETYKTYRRFLYTSAYVDPLSKLTLKQAFLLAWLTIHDVTLPLTEEERQNLRVALGLAMIHGIYEYGVTKTCASGAHNLLIDTLAKAGLPGVYSFSNEIEKKAYIDELKRRFSVQGKWQALPVTEQEKWFVDESEYQNALKECKRAFDQFLRFGQNDRFSLLRPDQIEEIKKTHAITWEKWLKLNKKNRATAEQMVVSSLSGLSKHERELHLNTLASLQKFVENQVKCVKSKAISKENWRALQARFEHPGVCMSLRNYADVLYKPLEESLEGLHRWVQEQWNDYYMKLDAGELSALLQEADVEPAQDLTKDRVTFAKLDKQRLISLRPTLGFSPWIEALNQAYQDWLDPLEEAPSRAASAQMSLDIPQPEEVQRTMAVPMEVDEIQAARKTPANITVAFDAAAGAVLDDPSSGDKRKRLSPDESNRDRISRDAVKSHRLSKTSD